MYYKGFNKDMTCKGFQYEEGKEYHEEEAIVCKKGFHACEYPLDCFNYYNPAESVFHEVELGEDAYGDGNDTKKCSKSIKVGARLDIAGIVKAAINYTRENCVDGKSAGNRSALSGGDRSALSGGDWSALSGGDWSALSGGYRSALSGGYQSALSGGYRSALSGGDWSALSGGYRSALSGGNRSALSGGYQSVLRGGEKCKYRGGMWSVFAAEIWNNGRIISIKTAVVDGESIKPDTWYQFDGKEFIKSNE